LQEGFLIPNAIARSSNARTVRNNAEAQNEQAIIAFSLNELETMQKRKGDVQGGGISC
jgi:hypothetical protein